MLRQFGTAAGAQVAGHANFNRNLALGQLLQQFRIFGGSEGVADAFGFEIERAPDGFRSGAFSGVDGEMKAVLGGAMVNRGEPFGRAGALVAANPEGGAPSAS